MFRRYRFWVGAVVWLGAALDRLGLTGAADPAAGLNESCAAASTSFAVSPSVLDGFDEPDRLVGFLIIVDTFD